MTTRWCILSAPRSGSNWLEENICRNITEKYKIHDIRRYGEILHHTWYYDMDKKINGSAKFSSIVRQQHFKKVSDIIKTTDISMTMRIFPESWHRNSIDLDAYFIFLKKNNFKIVYLKRNFVDRMLSFLVADAKGIWHKRWYDNNWHYSTNGEEMHYADDIHKPEHLEKITIDVNRMEQLTLSIKLTDYYNIELSEKYADFTVNYETLDTDCRVNDLTVNDTAIKKLYGNIEYSEIIDNYEQVIKFIECMK
jgi:hypothetical protein